MTRHRKNLEKRESILDYSRFTRDSNTTPLDLQSSALTPELLNQLIDARPQGSTRSDEKLKVCDEKLKVCD